MNNKIDHLTKLEIVQRYRNGEKIFSIRNRLSQQGKNYSWHVINYYINKYRNGEFDNQIMPEIPGERNQQFDVISRPSNYQGNVHGRSSTVKQGYP